MSGFRLTFERDRTAGGGGRRDPAAPAGAWGLGVLALLCALAGLSLAPSPARAEGTGKITGTVTDAVTGDQLEAIGVCARLIGTGGASCTETGERIGGERGKYEIGALEEGSYEVEFFQGPFEHTYLVQFWDDKESEGEAEPVAVTEGETTGDIDAAMHEGGRITGTVTDALGGGPVRGIEACALEPTGNGSPIGCVESDAAGGYTIEGLYSGSYKVRFSPTGQHCDCAAEDYRTQFYDGVGSWAEAEPVPVSQGEATGDIDARMVSARTLTVSLAGGGSGTVTSAPGGIDCGSTCSAEFAGGETVTLTATPAPGSTFAGWSGGGCEGTGTCRVTLTGDLAVTAGFEPAGGGTTESPSPTTLPATPTPGPPVPRPPGTKISAAKIGSQSGTATFRFGAIGTATGFRCRLKGPHGQTKSGRCSSPRIYRHLKPGGYVFSVRAIGPGGTDRSAARRRFRIGR